MVVGENKSSNIMDGIESTGDVRLHDHRLRLKQRFDIVRKLGQGTYGKVQLGINKKTGQEVAIKTIKKCKIETEADLVRIRREVQIMSSVRHPNIVHIYEVFENSEKMILVMEYCSGGELYDYLSQKKVLEEEEARRLFRQIATAVYYCHIHKICHRDLKLENVLLDETGSAKIADFGLSNVFKESALLATFCGSPLYASPEIVKGTPYVGPEVDCWSLGVLLYTLVYGAMPFDGSNFKRLVKQISNGDYYEPKNPSSASPLIRDMLTVDPQKRADIIYICDHPWVNAGYSESCLAASAALAALTPVRLDLLLSLAAPPHAPRESSPGAGAADEGGAELCRSVSMMAVEPSSSAEQRILELVAEGGEDAIKPSPTRTIVADSKRRLGGPAVSASAAGVGAGDESPPAPPDYSPPPLSPDTPPPMLTSSATMTITPRSPTPPPPAPAAAAAPPAAAPAPAAASARAKPEVVEQVKEEPKPSPAPAPFTPAAPAPLPLPAAVPAPAPAKPKKFPMPGGNVGSFKEQFERRASLTAAPEPRRAAAKPAAASKIAKPKAASEDRELAGAVRLQQIGVEPAPSPPGMLAGGVLKTESEPAAGADPGAMLQDARRSLQSSMARLAEARGGDDARKKSAARDIITTAIRAGKPPVPYSRSSSAGVTSLSAAPVTSPRVFRTEAQLAVDDHRNRGSVERIIPIHIPPESPSPPRAAPAGPARPAPAAAAAAPAARPAPLRRLVSAEAGEAGAGGGEPIKKSAREFIIPIAVEGKGYVTPRQGSLEPDTTPRRHRPRRISSLVSGGESEEEDDSHMHRLRPSRAARAESVSSGEEDEEEEGFHMLTAENLFSTLLDRVRALTSRLNGEEGPGFPQRPHSLFNKLQSPFFNSSHMSRRHKLFTQYMENKLSVSETREGWGARDMQADFDNMFKKSRQSFPREAGVRVSAREAAALAALTPALARRLAAQLLAAAAPEPAPGADRPRLTKYLERAASAPGAPPARRRVSRFLRPDFFDTPPDESVYVKHKREKELETQKILREIREKRSRAAEGGVTSPTCEGGDRKCLSPLGVADRSRSLTPFYSMLDNVKETFDSSKRSGDSKSDADHSYEEDSKESKLLRPKSYPMKCLDATDRPKKERSVEPSDCVEYEKENVAQKESKLTRPKSYPTTSPSPEKVNNRHKRDEKGMHKTEVPSSEKRSDIEVSFNVSLPKKNKYLQKSSSIPKSDISESMSMKKYQIIDNDDSTDMKQPLRKYQVTDTSESAEVKQSKQNGSVSNGSVVAETKAINKDDTKYQVTNHDAKTEQVKLKPVDTDSTETDKVDGKKTIKKKIIRKVSSKSKADIANQNETESKTVEKKKITKKVKDKPAEETKLITAPKKKSMLQSIGHKLEKFANKSCSPEKDKSADNKITVNGTKTNTIKLKRTQREHSVPIDGEPTTESNLIKRAVTLTDVAGLENTANVPNKTTVSKVLGLFKKFEPKDKVPKPIVEKINDNVEPIEHYTRIDSPTMETEGKPKRPTSLLLNGIGRKNKYGRTASDSESVLSMNTEDPDKVKKITKRNSLKLDFSRLPRVKKIVPTEPVIEPRLIYTNDTLEPDLYCTEKTEPKFETHNNGKLDAYESSREEGSRSRSRSSFSTSDGRADSSSLSHEPEPRRPHRERDPTTPDAEDIGERIRRKSFYTRFNEKKHRRRSTLVGPGAAEYDPVARLTDASPTSPYDLSPGCADPPLSPRARPAYLDSYRSLDRAELRRRPHRAVSLLDDPPPPREPAAYGRTLSLYAPGSYATYRPRRAVNTAILLKECEPSPQNIIDKIRSRKKISISVTRPPDRRPSLSPKSEVDGSERSEKAD